MTPRKIIIDTDPGQDDAVAILLALASPELEVLALTCVAGNVPLALNERNARMICELAGRSDLPVYAGCDAPLSRKLVTAENVHGKTGLDGIELPQPEMQLSQGHGVDYIIETLRTEPAGTITLVPIGPLTNIAEAMRRAPDIIPRIDQIVLMGGGHYQGGNITPMAEFNIFVDPEAAAIVMESGADIVILPLDCTHEALTDAAWLQGMRDTKTSMGEAIASWTDYSNRYDTGRYGDMGAPLHDPCTIAWLLWPDLFTGKQINVTVETHSELCLGATVADWWHVSGRKPNALYMRHVMRDKLFARMSARLHEFCKKTT